ncbi:MAG: response regulator [Promethearchaeota archaeon]|nr:MAG: response regulator [Candidatus Lokiarchaeota archaeon]
MNILNFSKEQVEEIVKKHEEGMLTEDIKRLMEKYESETGKYAVWRDKVTEGFKKYLMGEKIYDRNKERVSLYVSEEKKNQWQRFLEENNINTISRLIRLSVKHYMENFKNHSFKDEGLSNLSHSLKSPLTVIKGYSQFILQNNLEEISEDVAETLQNIFDKSVILENKINNMLENIKPKNEGYSILLIEDDLATIRLVTSYFKSKNYICKGVVSGSKGLEELQNNKPKIILLDIILPDLTGYDICQRIKKDEKLRDIPLYFLTAISKNQVEKELTEIDPELHPDGFIPKPFDFSDFNILFQHLQG